MILFREDWSKEENFGAIVDTNTSNKSFLRIAGLLKKMGVKNHTFMLALHDRSLVGVDPYSKELSKKTKIKIATECKINPWYFFREVLRLPPPAGNDSIPLRANRANISFLWLAFNHITQYLIMGRQQGKSVIGDALDAYNLNIASTNADITVITKDDKLRAKTARSVKEIIELLPDYLQMMSKKDIKNSEKITVKKLNNLFSLYVGQKDKKAADNLGRGLTVPMMRIDEFAYIYNIETSLSVALSATTAAREVAEQVGAPYHTIFTTTPGKLNSPDGKFAYNVYNESLRWNEAFFDMENLDKLKKMIEKNSGKYEVMLLEYNHRMLGFTDEWLKTRLKAALSSGEDADSDYFLKWINGGYSSPIHKELLDIIVDSKRTKYTPFISNYGYVVKFYVDNRTLENIKRDKFLVIGLDTSDALGGKNDAMSLVLRDSNTGSVIGAGNFNETNLSMFADFLVELLEEFPNSVLIPERKSSASSILDSMFRIMLVKKINPFKRIFNKVVNDAAIITDETRKLLNTIPTLDTINKYKRSFGYTSSGTGEMSRSLLYGNVFRASLKYTSDRVYDTTLISQLSGLKIINNRIDHESGNHDDMVIAWLLAFYFLQYAKNTELYGLSNKLKLNNVIDSELLSKNSDVDKEYIKEQMKLRSTIEQLISKLNSVENETIGFKILSKIKFLEKKIDTKIVESLDIESLLKNIKLYKRLKRERRRVE